MESKKNKRINDQMKTKKILVYWKVTDRQKQQIMSLAERLGYLAVFAEDTKTAEEEAVDAEILFGGDTGPLKKAVNARWFCSDWAGVNSYLVPGVLPGDDIIISNSSGAYGVTISEHMIMVTLMMMRNFRLNDMIMAGTDWSDRNTPMDSLAGSRITVLGTGDIGTTFASRVRSFCPAAVTGVNRHGKKPSSDYDRVYTVAELGSVLPETDVLAMSLPETPETIGLLDEKKISLLPRNAYIVNVGRGSAIDEAALVKALNEERIAGAALDVMCTEPLPPDDPLRSAKNILLTPHCAGQMTLGYTQQKAVDMFCEDLINYTSGRPLKNQVDKKAGY